MNGNAFRENRAELTARRRRLLVLGDKPALQRHEAMHMEARLRCIETRLRGTEL